jgi:hypothetical protein
MRNFDTFCDTTYLWILQLAEFIKAGEAAAEKAADQIAADSPEKPNAGG